VELTPIGHVESPVAHRGEGVLQGFEGAPPCWIVIDPTVTDGARDLRPDDEAYILTWLHLTDRTVLRVHPRGDENVPLTGVFSTRSPDRPNPIGLHRVTVTEVVPDDGDGIRLQVSDLEAIDGTPVIDIKPVLPGGR
jgi:tRNA-Thr(GGU) m(6)t(6)A37 methyltransferase TsaA